MHKRLKEVIRLMLLPAAALSVRLGQWSDPVRALFRYNRWWCALGGLGQETLFAPGVVIRSPHKVFIGSHCSLAERVHIFGGGKVYIGDNTLIAAHTIITSDTHDPNAELYRLSLVRATVHIGANVWLGSACIILPGVRIGDGVIIGAGSVVTKDVPANAVALGVPAKVVRVRS